MQSWYRLLQVVILFLFFLTNVLQTHILKMWVFSINYASKIRAPHREGLYLNLSFDHCDKYPKEIIEKKEWFTVGHYMRGYSSL